MIFLMQGNLFPLYFVGLGLNPGSTIHQMSQEFIPNMGIKNIFFFSFYFSFFLSCECFNSLVPDVFGFKLLYRDVQLHVSTITFENLNACKECIEHLNILCSDNCTIILVYQKCFSLHQE